MASRARVGYFGAGLFACLWLHCDAGIAHSTEFPSPGATNVSGAEPAPVMAPFFEEQQDIVQQAIEQARREAEAAARRNGEALLQRLDLIQQALQAQHQRALDAAHSSNRTTLMVAGVLAGIGFLGMFTLAFFLMRATNRLTELAVAVPLNHAPGPGPSPHALTAGGMPLAANPAELAGARFLGAIEQLEKRLHELEQTAQLSHVTVTAPLVEGQSDSAAAGTTAKSDADSRASHDQPDPFPALESAADSGHAVHVALLLAKGRTLLSLDKPADALGCFDEAIALDSRNAEALVKKGAALEKLRRMEEAIECYDRAIAVDRSLTTAYLCKGGVFNRLQRYEEALKCYEQALQTEQKALAS